MKIERSFLFQKTVKDHFAIKNFATIDLVYSNLDFPTQLDKPTLIFFLCPDQF